MDLRTCLHHIVLIHKELSDVEDVKRVSAAQVRAANLGCGGHGFPSNSAALLKPILHYMKECPCWHET
jgi:hypothetical protein